MNRKWRVVCTPVPETLSGEKFLPEKLLPNEEQRLSKGQLQPEKKQLLKKRTYDGPLETKKKG